jgi:hypothetical protein
MQTMDMLEIGFYSAVTAYCLIAVWAVLVRLRWLPTSLVRFVHRPLNRLEQIPVLGRVVNACRKYSLSLGFPVSLFVGIGVSYSIVGLMWGAYYLAFGIAAVLGAMAMLGGADDEEIDPDRMYLAKHGHDLVHGSSPYADPDRPL